MRISTVAATIAVLMAAPAAWAEIQINGFASIVAGSSLDDDESLYGYDSEIDFNQNTKFAIQVAADLGGGLRATAQLLSRGRDDYDVEFEWAYLSYDITDNLMLMAGRQRFNLYKYSDYIDVGFAYHWIIPPQGVYSLPFSSGEGVGLVYSTLWGDTDVGVTYKYITSSIDDYIPSGTNVDAAPYSAKGHILNLNFTTGDFEYGLNLGYVSDLSYEYPDLIALAAAVNATGLFPAQASDDILPIDDSASIIGVHAKYDPGSWFVLAEYTSIDLDPSAFALQDSAFVSGGIRFGAFTLHATYGWDENKPQYDALDAMLPVYNALPPTAQPQVAPLIGLTQMALETQQQDSYYYTLGMRWDFHSSAAFKVEYTAFTNDKGPATDGQVLLMGVDLVF
ncbi:porin [Shewanella litorisediminis]|uniref:Porin n=1 Tax=Shewanella litorisediminis TaxID=1173586 RepID=A0ABX7G7U4_9GAMM|nr:porin [Shewanella litorisediminis]MCL2919097.1 porin [Shewanella litorisediminis]QRH03352.1 porin [Shewanella litorisediminis]